MFGRRAMPARLVAPWETFLKQAERVETARRALLSCLPVGRVDPVPVPVGLDLLRDELRDVGADLADWRVPEVEAAWQSVRAANAEAKAAVDAAHHVAATSTELEELLNAVAEVVEPLDAWHDAERTWLDLRRRA
jgi:hypothetical protein